MKRLIRYPLALTLLAAALTLQARAADVPAPGFVDFGKLLPSSAGGEFVEVHLKNNLISMVAKLAAKDEPEVAEILKGLQLVRVNVVELKDDNRAEIKERLGKIRTELEGKGWERIVTVQDKKEDVGVYLKTRGDEAVEGVVVTVLEGDDEAVFINIVGDIKPEKLVVVGERFNIEPLKKVKIERSEQKS